MENWTSDLGYDYHCVYAHYLDENLKQSSTCLANRPVDWPYEGQLKEILRDFRIPINKVKYVVTKYLDIESNDFEFLPCLETIIKKVCKNVNRKIKQMNQPSELEEEEDDFLDRIESKPNEEALDEFLKENVQVLKLFGKSNFFFKEILKILK